MMGNGQHLKGRFESLGLSCLTGNNIKTQPNEKIQVFQETLVLTGREVREGKGIEQTTIRSKICYHYYFTITINNKCHYFPLLIYSNHMQVQN